MLEISIHKVKDPGCLWARIVKGPGIQVGGPRDYDALQIKMNLFYHEVNLDVQKIRPGLLEEGQVCVVFSPGLRSWCRAIVESVFLGTVGTQALCFLVDYGEHIVVTADDVRSPLDQFLELPFWVRKFELAGVHPMRLQVSISQEKAELVLASHWDSSATRYLHNLLKASSLVEADLCETSVDCTAIQLYVTIRNVKICVNDDLVVKKFACFSSGELPEALPNGAVDRSPVTLACDLFSSPDHFLTINECYAVRSSPADIFARQDRKDDPMMESAGEHSRNTPPQMKSMMSTARACTASEGTTIALNKEAGGRTGRKQQKKETHKESACEQKGRTGRTLSEEFAQNVNFYRLMRFLKPTSHFEQNIKLLEEETQREEREEGGCSKSVLEVVTGDDGKPSQTDEQRSADVSVDVCSSGELDGVRAVPEQPSAREELACARLLQLLNPDPLRPDSDPSETSIVGRDLSHSGVLVHSAISFEPCAGLSCAPITENFRKFLMRRKYAGPAVAESYCWPSVARGCDTVLVSHGAHDPLSYVPPLLAQLQLASVFSPLTTHTGPRAVILCPSWEKVEEVMELLEESKASQSLHPTAALLGLAKDEASSTKIHHNCQLLVTTPGSLSRLLAVHCFCFLRLCHLVLDEADKLYSRAPQQMADILQHFQKVTSTEERAICPRQIVAVCSRWSPAMESLIRDHMTNPCIIITAPKEAALYGRVHQIMQLCQDCTKTSMLLSTLDFSPSSPQKTLIITNSAEEVEHVYKAVSNTCAFSLRAHENMTHQFEFIMEQWRKDVGPGTQVVLVTTNDCIESLGIRDATCVVHYGFPSSPKLFGCRLFCMSENFQNLSNMDRAERSSHVARSVLLLSERNTRHVAGVLRYLKRSDAALPPELLQFAQGVQQAKEEQKTDRPLCNYLKTTGICRDSSVCPDRHTVSATLDKPLHPSSGTIVVLPLYIKSASIYYGRLVSQRDDSYENLAAQITAHYTRERLCAKDILEGALYGIQEEGVYHRVRVTKVQERGNCLFSCVTAHFVDEGRTQEVKSHQLLQLPAQYQELPSQAVEFILCRVQPIDEEVHWNPRVTRAISQKIKGQQHHAKVVLCLGNTIWVDPMVRMTRLPGLKTFINEYNVHAEVLATGMGTTNPQHLELLRELIPGEAASRPTEPSQTDRCESFPVRLAGEETLACGIVQDRGEVITKALLPDLEEISTSPQSPSFTASSTNRSSIASSDSCLDASTNEDSQGRHSELDGLSPQNWPSAVHPAPEKDEGVALNEIMNMKVRREGEPQGFHPQIKWFQRDINVTLRIQLINPVMQKCEFFPNRVLYSGYLNGRRYCANLELHGDIIVEQCSWGVKCNEPVIQLVKKQRGAWKTLIQHKSAFVSYDFDHIEEDEEVTPSGPFFVEDTGDGEEGYLASSGSESD